MEFQFMTILLGVLVLVIIVSLFLFRSKSWGDKQFKLFKKLCSEVVPTEYHRDRFAKSKYGYTLKFKKTDKDYLILAFNPGWSDFSIVSKDFEVERFKLDDRDALLSGSEDMGISRISIQLLGGSGIFEITHLCRQSAPMSKDQLLTLLNKINIIELEGTSG
ncbi:MAG: hypothetical protein O7F74_04705 [Bacteroidetes bacterium]|nr:hypothetical protein [Bacteroidota bacterium]